MEILCRASVFLARVNNAPDIERSILSHRPTIAAKLSEVKRQKARLIENRAGDDSLQQARVLMMLRHAPGRFIVGVNQRQAAATFAASGRHESFS
jgi:hypothetical protein